MDCKADVKIGERRDWVQKRKESINYETEHQTAGFRLTGSGKDSHETIYATLKRMREITEFTYSTYCV